MDHITIGTKPAQQPSAPSPINDPATKNFDKLQLLRLMYLSREGDRREGLLLRQGKGWFQVAAMGHEPLAAIAMQMRAEDYLFPYYRDRPMALARGVPNADLADAYFAKRCSSSGGRQMPGHYSDRARNIWPALTPTGANMLPACGAAWAMQLQGTSAVAVATIGDAASRQGEFYEALAFAVERQLPVVFVVEDNGYGISTPTEQQNPFHLGVLDDRLPVTRVDAHYPDMLITPAAEALDRARQGLGPSILWCRLDRLCSHTASDDHRVYRSQQEIDAMQHRDPIDALAQQLIADNILSDPQWQQIKNDIDAQVDQEYQAAEGRQDPIAEELLDHLLGEAPAAQPPTHEASGNWRMLDAVNQVFRSALDESDQCIFFGEDIADPKGGVFRLTAGLSSQAPGQVFNSPLAEATILGVACGMAAYGMRPIFELQFVDFVGPAWNQISQNLATLRWRSFGHWQCPAVIYAPYGAYLPGGSLWHSQANESLFVHTPGLRVVIPSTPEDAAGLMWTAIRADDPTIFLLPKHLLRQHQPVPDQQLAVAFGSARLRRSGTDVSVISWGNCMELALEAAEQLAPEVSVEVIDLRSLQPWDRATVIASLDKTGRLVIIQEDSRSCSVGQMIISELVNDPETWSLFFSAPQLVSKPDVHIGYHPAYEYAALPDTSSAVQAIRLTLED